MEPGVVREFMRRLPLFEGLSEADLERLQQMSRHKSLAAGEYLMREGETGDALFIITGGRLEVVTDRGGQEQILAVREEGEVVGEMALLEKTPRSASVRALQESRVQVIDQAALQTLLACSPGAALTILETVVARLRSNEAMMMQQEKLAALGRMAAGLAHELNNPAAAIQRSAKQLEEALAGWGRATADLLALPAGAGQSAALIALRQESGLAPASGDPGDPLASDDAESGVARWLEERGVEASWELAPALVTAGWTLEKLSEIARRFAGENLPAVLRWLAAAATADALLQETSASARAISSLVLAVKNYVYLDRAPVQDVDLHESLENTLVILRHRTKAGIRVRRDYAKDLPRIEAYAGELNQVWTNIIDNAIGAMGGRGTLELRTRGSEGRVLVEITDDGPGIPPEVEARLFEPFFTTKPVGAGTGLGLHIAYNIVVHRHRGQIRVESRPGTTTFQVVLPLKLRQEGTAPPAA